MLQDVENDHITIYPKFSASGAESRDHKITVLRRDRAIEGILMVCLVYDEIYEVGSFPGRASSHEVPLWETVSWPTKWLVEILRLTYHEKRGSWDFSENLRAATRTSIGGVGFNQDTKLARIGDDRFLDAIYLLHNGIKYIKEKRIKLGLQKLLANRDFKRRIRSSIAIHAGLGGEIIGKSLRRLPFITRNGHLALGSEYVKRGDFVALIKGAQVPFVLRRQSGEKYQLIGEAYVDGIMDGEVAEDSKFSDITLV